MNADGKYEPIIGAIVSNENDKNALFDKARDLGVKAQKIPIKNCLFIFHIIRAAMLCKGLKIDLIHSHGYKATVFGYFIKKILNIPEFSTCHLRFAGEKMPLKMYIMVKLETFFYKLSPIIISVSEPIKKFLIRSGIRGNKIKIINNGINIAEYQGYNSQKWLEIRNKMGLGEDEFVVLNIGRLTGQKAQKGIIEAAEILNKAGNCVRFFLVGDGELRDELEEFINAKKMKGIVQILGFRPDIKELLWMSDIFLLPSLDEGMPISLLEAVASGRTVIATSVGDIPRLIRHDESGLIIPIRDSEAIAGAIRQLQTNRYSCERLSQGALRILREKYSSVRMYREYEMVFKKLLESH